jgi:hypothetical protein
VSQKKRKLVEKVFGWMKQDRLRQTKLRGLGAWTGCFSWPQPRTICCA